MDDYFQEVASRDDLERTYGDNLPQSVRSADQRFDAFTRSTPKTRLSGAYWWHFRLPLRAGKEFHREAQSMGF